MDTINLFDTGASRFPDRACYIAGDQAISYRATKALSERVARRLHQLGIGKECKVGVLSVNDPVAFTCVLGTLRAGAVWVPLNPRSTPQEQAYLLDAFDVEILFFHSLMQPVVDAVRPLLGKLREVICIDRDLDGWLGGVEAGPVPRRFDPDACAAIAATGGTTGLPKGVMLSHRNIEAYAAIHLCCAGNGGQPPVHLVAAPMTHAAGIICLPIMAQGGTNVILAKPDPQLVLQAIERHRVTDLFLPPTVIYSLLAQPNVRDFDLSSLRHLLYGAAPMSTDKLREAISVFGPVMTQAFGQTEAPMMCTFMSPEEHLVDGAVASDDRLGSCGRPTPFIELEFMDDDGGLVEDGGLGEIVLRGNLVMLGYYKNSEATAESRKHGWHHTGDIGFRDPNGYIHIVDRKKDMIISGGFNIYSAEVEKAVLTHAAVLDCAVIGVPDDKWGEAVKAVVQLKPGANATEDDIIERCKALIGSVKSPKTVEVWPDLPRSPVGKVLKRDIRNRYWDSRLRAVN